MRKCVAREGSCGALRRRSSLERLLTTHPRLSSDLLQNTNIIGHGADRCKRKANIQRGSSARPLRGRLRRVTRAITLLRALRLLGLGGLMGLVACRFSGPSPAVLGPDVGAGFTLPAEVMAAERAARDQRADEAEAILLAAGGVSADAPERS